MHIGESKLFMPCSIARTITRSSRTFVERLLAEEGLGYAFVEEDEAPAGHSLTLFADSAELPEDASSASDPLGQGIRFHRAGATEQSDTIQRIGLHRRLAPAQITLLSHDYKPVAATTATAALPSAAEVGREVYDPAGAYAFADSREARHYADLAAQAHEVRQQIWEGRGSVRTARAGTRFRLSQGYLDTSGAPSELVWTQVWHTGINNLPDGVREVVDRHLEPGEAEAPFMAALWERAGDVGHAMHFHALTRTQPWRPALTDAHGLRLNPRPTTPGPQTALVVGPEGETAPGASGPLHTDKLGRLKVKFHWMEDGASCWLRCTQRYAGPGHGAQFLPRIGQEVLVDFLGGDIDRPIILGALYNGQGEAGIAPTPGQGEAAADGRLYTQAGDFHASAQGNLAGGHSPAWHGQSAAASGHANAAALSGIKTRGFDGTGHNQLVFDDTDQQGRLQLATTQAATQLNLGHLIHQADNYRGSFRGTGYELRSDGYGAIRGQRGLLLTTYAIGPGEPAADATAVGALTKQHAQLADNLSGAARTHKTVPLAGHEGTDQAHQSAISQKAAPLKAHHASATATVEGSDYAKADPYSGKTPHSADALTTVAGRGGIGTLAGQALHVAAGETLNVGAGKHINLAVADQLRLHANQGIGLVSGAQGARGIGLNLVAGKGALDVQAQHDTLALRSKDDLKLVSANANTELAAKKRIHLANSQGAYITIEGGNITFGCPGKLTVKAGNHKLVGGNKLDTDFPPFPGNVCIPCLLRAAEKALPFVTR